MAARLADKPQGQRRYCTGMMSVAMLSVLFTLLGPSTVNAFGIQVPAGGRATCFYREIHAESRVSVHFVAREIVNVNVKDTSGSVLYIKQGALEGQHTFTAQEDGPYHICVSTDAKRRAPTMTKFRFLVIHPRLVTSDIADSEQASSAKLLSQEILKQSEKALYATHLYSDTAAETDATLVSSIALTGRFAALECVSVLVVTLSQITYIRNLLVATRSKLRRVV